MQRRIFLNICRREEVARILRNCSRLSLRLALWAVILCAPCLSAAGQDDCDDLRNGLDLVPFGDASSFPDGAQVLPFCDYLRLLQSGAAAQIAPSILQQQREAAALREIEDEHFIYEYLAGHPELTDLAALVNGSPVPGPDLQPNGNGEWRLTLPDRSDVITLGRSTVVKNMAESIRFSLDRNGQWEMYRDLYSSLPPGIFDLDIHLPTPDSLADASIAAIQRALSDMADLAPLIQSMQPIGPPMSFAGCNFEIGASSLFGDYGFKNPTDPAVKACSIHDGFGLYATFNPPQFPNKPYLTCVKNQGKRGSCYNFAAMSATEMMIARDSADYVNLSEQDVMEHYKLGLWDPIPIPSWYVDGGSSGDIVKDIISHGYFIPYENSWDYNPSFSRQVLANGFFQKSCELPYPTNEPCSNTSPQAPLVCGLDPQTGNWYCSLEDAGIPGSSHTITSGGRFGVAGVPLATSFIRLFVAFNYGVTIDFEVTPNFTKSNHSKFGGYVTFDENDVQIKKGGHSVHVVGYISNEDLKLAIPDAPLAPKNGYFIIKNSWNSCWGDGGYAYLPWDYVAKQTYAATFVSGVQ